MSSKKYQVPLELIIAVTALCRLGVMEVPGYPSATKLHVETDRPSVARGLDLPCRCFETFGKYVAHAQSRQEHQEVPARLAKRLIQL